MLSHNIRITPPADSPKESHLLRRNTSHSPTQNAMLSHKKRIPLPVDSPKAQRKPLPSKYLTHPSTNRHVISYKTDTPPRLLTHLPPPSSKYLTLPYTKRHVISSKTDTPPADSPKESHLLRRNISHSPTQNAMLSHKKRPPR